MAKLKKQKQNLKLNRSIISEQPHCPKSPSFSFAYLTKNKRFNFESFSNDKSKRNAMQAELTKRLIEISQKPWFFWYDCGKNTGIETIPFYEINFSPNGLDLTPDEKVIVFRFASGKCRMIGTKGKLCSTCATYYVIGFDFNYSAYNHGS